MSNTHHDDANGAPSLRKDPCEFEWVRLDDLSEVTLQGSHDGRCVWVTFNRPHRLNALNKGLLRDLCLVFEALASPQGAAVGVVVLTGAGRGFCSGADLKAVAGGDGPSEAWDSRLLFNQRAFSRVVSKIRRAPQLVVAALNGLCVGGGFSIACACDVRFAVGSAKLHANFAQLGLSSCELGVSHSLPRLIGLGRT